MKIIVVTIYTLIVLIFSNHSWAIDLQPGDIVAPTPGLNLIQLSYLTSEFGDRYVQGNKQPIDARIQVSQFLVRLGRSFEVADMPSFFYLQTPVGYVHPENDLSAYKGDDGVGDTSMLFALWPYTNRATKTYFAVGAYLTVPTGSYDNKRLFNMGSNRYQAALQVGYQRPVFDNLDWSAAIDTIWFGDNDDYSIKKYRREQGPLYTAQTALRYGINASYALAATYFYTAGGETAVNSIDMHDDIKLQRYQLSLMGYYSFGILTLQYGQDVKTDNGFIEDSRWIVRYTKIF